MNVDLADKRTRRIVYLGLFVFSVVFYLIWYWHDGVIMTPDGLTYIDMTSDREPGYCTFLWIFRTMLGKDRYLDAVVIVQCLIAGYAAAALAMELQRRFQLHWFWMVCMLVIEYGITLLNRFVAQRRYSYYNSICTEALAYSFWILFFISLLGIVYDRDKKSIMTGVVWSIVLISIRKHMMISLGLLFLAVIYAYLCKKSFRKAVPCAVCIAVVVFAGTRLIDCVYNDAVRGVFAPHTGDSSFIFGNEIYVANKDMAQNISSEENRAIFLEILERADGNQYNIAYAGEGWMGLEDHYSLSYDRIKFDTVMPVIREYQQQNGIPEDQRESGYEKIVNEMSGELLGPCLPDLFRIFISNVIHGLITTVLKVHRILNWIALLIYMAYIALLLLLAWKKSNRVVECSVLPFAIVVLTAIAANVVFTSATIYCQMRYMLYNTAFFYQSGLIMLIEGAKLRKNGEGS